MSNVSEREIISCMTTNFRSAAHYCDQLAVVPERGAVYRKLIKSLSILEGCCRQLAVYREDCRWYHIGGMMAEAHRRSGSWLRKFPRTTVSNEAHPLFLKLADNLRLAEYSVERLTNAATGVSGPIIPGGKILDLASSKRVAEVN